MSEENKIEEENTKKLPVKKRYIFTSLAIIGALAAGYFIYDALGYQSTDDAYVETTTVSVSPKVSGQIVKVLVKDNQPVKAGQVVAVIGKDTVGILAKVSGICAEHNANVMDVTQTIMQDLFAMTMMIEISKLNIDYIDFADKLTKEGSDMGLQVHVMHEDIFNAMHRI